MVGVNTHRKIPIYRCYFLVNSVLSMVLVCSGHGLTLQVPSLRSTSGVVATQCSHKALYDLVS